jgi:hypothetical protein
MSRSNAKLVTMDELREYDSPEFDPDGRWKPFPHADIVEMIRDEATDHGFEMDPESLRLQVSHEGDRLFGSADVHNEVGLVSGSSMSLGFMSSYDKSISFRLVAGARVFVCSNMLMFGSGPRSFEDRHIHSKYFEPVAMIGEAFEVLDEVAALIRERQELLRATRTSDELASYAIMRAATNGAVQRSKAVSAFQAWEASKDGDPEECEIELPGTAWALQQAITMQWRDSTDFALPWRTEKLEEVMDELVA